MGELEVHTHHVVTDRLELTPFTADAIDALLSGNAPTLERLTGCRFPAPLRPPPLMEELLPLVRERLRAEPASLGWWTWLAADRATHTVVGALGFGGPPNEEGAVMMGYATYPEANHRGYATEAVQGLVKWALEQPGVRRICASIPPDNHGARRVAEKVGMRPVATVWEEEIDDVLLYAVDREES
jgi:ribosomal-protein-alanine N-acetyltransferase